MHESTIRARVRRIALPALLALSGAVQAADAGDANPPACQGGFKVATGPAKKGYANLYRDIAATCGRTIQLCEVRTTGGLANLDVLATKKADVAFAQIDTFKQMAAGNPQIAALQAVMPLNWNYIHVLTNRAGYAVKGARKWGILPGSDQVFVIRKFSDLAGRRVALVGSAQLVGRALALGPLKRYNMEFVDAASDKDAFAMVRAGTVHAVFTVGGNAHGAVSELGAKDGLALVPLDEELGGQYSVRKLNYSNLATYNLKAAAVQNVMLTRPFGASKAAQVAQLRQCLVDHLTELRDGEYDPAWNEMDPDAALDLPKFTPPNDAAISAPPAGRGKRARQ